MAVTIDLMNNASKDIVVNKSLSTIASLSGDFRATVDALRPTIIVDGAVASNVNYAYMIVITLKASSTKVYSGGPASRFCDFLLTSGVAWLIKCMASMSSLLWTLGPIQIGVLPESLCYLAQEYAWLSSFSCVTSQTL